MKKNEVVDSMEMALSFQKGEEKGFNYFFKEFYAGLLWYGERIIPDRPVVEDVVMESYVKIWERRYTFNHPMVIKSWLYTTVRNTCINRLQERKRSLNYPKELIEVLEERLTIPDQLSVIIYDETISLLKEGLEQLPSECRKIFRSLYLEGKTVREIHEESGLAITTIKNQKGRGLKIIKSIITEDEVISYKRKKSLTWSNGHEKRTDTIASKVRALRKEGKSYYRIAQELSISIQSTKTTLRKKYVTPKYKFAWNSD